MSFRALCLILTGVLLHGILLVPANALAQSTESIDSKHVFDDTNLIVVFQMQRLESQLDDEAKAGLARSHSWLKDILHLPTDKCKEIIFQIGAETYPEETGHRALNKTVGIAFRCEDDISDKELDAFRGRFDLADFDHETVPYYMQNSAREPTFYFGENSMLICETVRTIAMIESERASEDREVKILETIGRETDIAIRIDFSNESFQQFFPTIFRDLDHFRDAECLTAIAENASFASLNINLDGMHPFTLEVQVAEDGDIEKLKSAVEEFADAGQKFAAMLQRELTRGAPSKGVTDGAVAFADSFAALLAEPEITSDLSTVTLQINDAETVRETLNEFVKMMNALAEHFGA